MSDVKRTPAICGALWLVAVCGAAILALWRYRLLNDVVPVGPSGNGGDFWTFLQGARQISKGRSLYSFADISQGYGYVYSPLLAITLLPFSAAATIHVWHIYTALSITCLALFAILIAASRAAYLRSWRQPLFFGFTLFTILLFMPTEVELANGQTDAFVLVFLAMAVLEAESGRPGISGALIGGCGLIKTWPAIIALAFFRRHYSGRWRALTGLVLTLLFGPALALATGGRLGLSDFIRITIYARSQRLISYSVWDMPKVLFSRTGLARPVLISFPLQVGLTLILAALVTGLLVVVLYWGDGSDLGMWNVVGGIVLLLPVSHSAYTLYLLPLFWIWTSRWLAAPQFSGLVFVVAALLALWWVVLFHEQWDAGQPTSSSLHYSVLFFVNLAAVLTSIIGDHLIYIRAEQPTWSKTPIKGSRLSFSGRPAPRHAAKPTRRGA